MPNYQTKSKSRNFENTESVVLPVAVTEFDIGGWGYFLMGKESNHYFTLYPAFESFKNVVALFISIIYIIAGISNNKQLAIYEIVFLMYVR